MRLDAFRRGHAGWLILLVISTLISTALISTASPRAQLLSDEDLDQITAAGEPLVIAVGANSQITVAGATEIESVIAPFSQAGLRALVLNNVTGENQAANGLNIAGATAPGGQTNAINQSWGSINDLTAIVVPPVVAVANSTCGAATLICKGSSSVVVEPGMVRVLAATADHIITAGAGSNIVYSPVTSIGMTIESNSQNNLVALVVNNVTGLNQVGNAINLRGGNMSIGDDGITITAVPAPGGGGQHNVLTQYRGTPSNFSRQGP